jgi:hypothetical protein
MEETQMSNIQTTDRIRIGFYEKKLDGNEKWIALEYILPILKKGTDKNNDILNTLILQIENESKKVK